MAIDFGKRMGLGCLRLPLLDINDQSSIDYDTLDKMIDILQEKGFNYYDTAYIYHNQLSEDALGRCLVDRYPRDSFLLSTKMPMKFMTKKEDMERIFEEQLKKCHDSGSASEARCRKRLPDARGEPRPNQKQTRAQDRPERKDTLHHLHCADRG